jgi:hypothetical protein
MTPPEWRIRTARPADRSLLTAFTCADSTVAWELEVEHFIQTHLADWTFDPHATDNDPRLLLAFDTTGTLFGVAAHERVVLESPTARFNATKLEVVAVTTAWQGRHFPSGERASDILMSAALTDVSVRVPPRHTRVFAVVHEGNHRSLALCHRHGLVEELTRPHPNYRRLVTAHRRQ